MNNYIAKLEAFLEAGYTRYENALKELSEYKEANAALRARLNERDKYISIREEVLEDERQANESLIQEIKQLKETNKGLHQLLQTERTAHLATYTLLKAARYEIKVLMQKLIS